ncbi:hypothetical protein A5906_04500 [Bradyrhizobium sacchari]|uniref:Uncharacterized protein n=1 Tax=Bradyrhizobium sacchari TaxID=1399419 RepID=A0A560KMQ1_9BRAD|nr:hypothetical protein [Bradyrhizobium sacchari]OPY96514.1 hypothetical protein A5906_04500 [Bradyrhizobium sacchari]TWB67288.1 hypothetical protein FBZ94_101970 [Bradyrhizobium sacchari]TWB84525.1 hypothetical protein FBZ95_101970 [Bradyrhizobium sacchari]
MDENIVVCEPEAVPETRLVDRRRAAAYVGVTAGRFEQLVRDSVVPPPVMVDNKRRWPLALLDVAKAAVISSMPCLPAIVADAVIEGRPFERDPTPPSHELPDQEWFEQRARFVQRVRRSLLSGNEIRLLREFKLLKQNEISMFGYYGSFEALMVRGYIVETARKPPSSRPLVTYRLTERGEQVVAALKDEPLI